MLQGCVNTAQIATDNNRIIEQQQRQLRELERQRIIQKIRESINVAAAETARKMMKDISPNTGRNPEYVVSDEIDHDERNSIASADVLIKWEARMDALSPRASCQVAGRMYIYFPTEKNEQTQSLFRYTELNDHVQRCAKQSYWKKTANGIVLTYK